MLLLSVEGDFSAIEARPCVGDRRLKLVTRPLVEQYSTLRQNRTKRQLHLSYFIGHNLRVIYCNIINETTL